MTETNRTHERKRVNSGVLAKVAADLQRFHPPLPPRPRRGDARHRSENLLNSLVKLQASESGSAGAATAFGRDPDCVLRRILMSQALRRARLPVQMKNEAVNTKALGERLGLSHVDVSAPAQYRSIHRLRTQLCGQIDLFRSV